jgi:hypothetical protein
MTPIINAATRTTRSPNGAKKNAPKKAKVPSKKSAASSRFTA